jgi:hypothetical protein
LWDKDNMNLHFIQINKGKYFPLTFSFNININVRTLPSCGRC